jgi:Icc protein
VIMLDTVEAGRHGGAFCETRADWLRAELAAHADEPVLIAMHHPPVVAGIAWMDPDPGEPWIARFAGAIAGHGNIQAIICGHVHRSVATTFAQVPLIICPSCAPAVALDFDEIDPMRADGRAMIVDKPPGFMLHRWDGHRLVSHFALANDHEVLARYDLGMQPLVSQNLAERP